MSDDPTQELPQPSAFEARVLAEFATIHEELADNRVQFTAIREELAGIRADIATLDARQQRFEERLTTVEGRLSNVEGRLTSLEEKVDSRLKETRPIWESVQLGIQKLDLKFDKVIQELYELHADVRLHDKRLIELEAR